MGNNTTKSARSIAESIGTLKGRGELEVISSDRERHGQDVEGDRTSKEQHLKLIIPVPKLDLDLNTDRTLLVIAADNSGSMAGNPLSQVKTALKDILSSCILDNNIDTKVITYDNKVTLVEYTERNYEAVIDSIKNGGTTNFIKPFQKINDFLKVAKENRMSKATIVFLTDGCDTCNNKVELEKESRTWMQNIRKYKMPVTVHTVGFSKGHDFKFLKTLNETGTGEGMFRYCVPDDGPLALRQKLQELFDFILFNTGQKMDVKLSFEGDNKIFDNGELKTSCIIPGGFSTKDEDKLELETECWVYLADPTSIPAITVHVEYKLKESKSGEDIVVIPCEIENITRKVLESDIDKVMWNIRVTVRNTDILASKIGQAVENKGDISKFTGRIDKLQEKLQSIPLFGRKIDKDTRGAIMNYIQDIQEKIDKMRSILADYSRGETKSLGMMARAHDMRYQAKFSKSRRQRLMDKRATKNINHAKTSQEQLETMKIDKLTIEQISQECAEFFFCSLAQNSVKDILIGTEVDDVIGFGLAVSRPEHVLDEPTAIRLHTISGTFVSRSSMLDALEYKLQIDGHLRAHGGFDFSDDIGITTVGNAREPINAWLPLYVTKPHWERVKVLMKQTLGSFCTLDPLGYDYKQVDVLFMVLGSMIGELSDEHIGEHQLKMLFAFQRTCAAVAKDFELVTQMVEVVEKFIASPAGRTKDVVPSLLAMIGYIVAIPHEASKQIFENETVTRKFWIALIVELLRRSANYSYRNISTHVVNGIICQLVGRTVEDKNTNVEDVNKKYVVKCKNDVINKDSPSVEYDPHSGLDDPAAKVFKYDPNMDKVMETWAQAQLGIIKNKNQMEKVSKANKKVEKWLKECEGEVGIDTRTPEDISLDHVTMDMLHTIVQLSKNLSRTSYPSCSTIFGCIGFVRYWLTSQPNFDDIDGNDGIAPDSWISDTRKVICQAYSEMKEFEDDCEVIEVQTSDLTEEVTPIVTESSDEAHDRKDTSSEHVGADDDYDDIYDDDDYDDDDGVGYTRSSLKAQTRNNITVPSLLHMANPDLDIFKFVRGMIGIVIKYHSNSAARAAITNGEFYDLATLTDVDNCDETMKIILNQLKKNLDVLTENAVKSYKDACRWRMANFFMIKTPSIWAFIGYLMNAYTERGEGFKSMIVTLTTMDSESVGTIPLLIDKIRILFLGKYEDYCVFAKGNVYIPDGKLVTALIQIIGQEEWDGIDVEIRSNVKIHVYRESDIPNRHGHCNSNPYIPNSLRKRIGMPLLPENKRRSRSIRVGSKLTRH